MVHRGRTCGGLQCWRLVKTEFQEFGIGVSHGGFQGETVKGVSLDMTVYKEKVASAVMSLGDCICRGIGICGVQKAIVAFILVH